MRALLLLVLLSTLAGCLWDDSQAQTPPKECAMTTDPAKCNQGFKR